MIKKVLYAFLILLLMAMVYLGIKSYKHAINYEKLTSEIVEYHGVEEQAKLTLEKFAKSLLGDLYEDERKISFDALKKKQQDSMLQAKMYTIYFMLVLFFLLSSYFFISLRVFTFFASLSAGITLFFGLITPILMVTIQKEVQYLGDIVLSFESKGIIGSIVKLWESDDYIVALVIVLFSVFVPIIKICSLLFISIFVESKFAHSTVKFFKAIGKWSMVDVFVVAVFLVYLTANKGDVSRAEVEMGLYFFLAYVIVSMLVSLAADKMLREKATL